MIHGSVIHADDLQVLHGLLQNAVKTLTQISLPVIDGNKNGYVSHDVSLSKWIL